MPQINVFINENSGNERLFYGKSDSGNTFDASITPLASKTRDELISEAIKQTGDDAYVLCAFDKLKTSLSSSEIYNVLEFATENIQFDIFYLTLYADRCRFSNDEYTYNNLDIKRTISPHGTECILISPNGIKKMKSMPQLTEGRSWDYFLNAKGEEMMLYSSYPPLVMVDISKRNKDADLIKSTVCREEINEKNPIELSRRYSGNMNLFWFFIIVVFILFIAAMLISLGGNQYLGGQYNGKLTDIPVGKQDLVGVLSD